MPVAGEAFNVRFVRGKVDVEGGSVFNLARKGSTRTEREAHAMTCCLLIALFKRLLHRREVGGRSDDQLGRGERTRGE